MPQILFRIANLSSKCLISYHLWGGFYCGLIELSQRNVILFAYYKILHIRDDFLEYA